MQKKPPQWTRVQSDIDGHDFSFSSEKKNKIWLNKKLLLDKSRYPTYEKQQIRTQNTEEGELRIRARKENKDCLCAASLNVQDLVLLVGSQWYLTVSLRPIAAGGASKVLRGGIVHCTWPIRRGKSIYFPGTISTLNAVEDPDIEWLCSQIPATCIYNGRAFS